MEVSWSEDAEADLARIFEFNLERNLDWALRVDARLNDGGNGLASLPRRGRRIGKTGLRLLSLVDVQYVISYRVDGEGVNILAVRSTREIRKST